MCLLPVARDLWALIAPHTISVQGFLRGVALFCSAFLNDNLVATKARLLRQQIFGLHYVCVLQKSYQLTTFESHSEPTIILDWTH